MRWRVLHLLVVCAGACWGQYGADLFVADLPRLTVGRAQTICGVAAAADSTTQVLLDVDGPGLVSRIWCVNAAGTLRVLVDGETEPRLEQLLAELPSLDLWPPRLPACTREGGGLLCRWVIGFKRHLRIEVRDAPPLRYEVNWVRTRPGQDVPEFAKTRVAPAYGTPERQQLMRHAYDDLAKQLRARGADGVKGVGSGLMRDLNITGSAQAKTVTIAAGATAVLYQATGPGSLRQLAVAPVPDTLAGLRGLRLRATWDGAPRPSVDVPLADLLVFALGRRGAGATGLYSRMGGYVVDWPMPHRRAGRVELVNTTSQSVQVRYTYLTGKPPTDDDGYFCATGVAGEPVAGQPFTLLDATGRGKYVGTVAALAGPAQARYLGGTVRFAVDGGETMSALDTSAYFGAVDGFRRGAWAGPFEGVTELWPDRSALTAYRWHGDAEVPFERSLKVTLDHGAANEVAGCRFRTVALWYSAAPATPEPMPADTASALFTARVDGSQVIEAETLSPETRPGSAARAKVISDSELTYQASGGKALAYWTPPGDEVRLRLPVARDGMYRVGWRGGDDGVWSVRVEPGGAPAPPFGAYAGPGQPAIVRSAEKGIDVVLSRGSDFPGPDLAKYGMVDVPRGTVDCFWLAEVGRVRDAIEAEELEPILRNWTHDLDWRSVERSPMVQGAEAPTDPVDSNGGVARIRAGSHFRRPVFQLRVPKAGRYGLAIGLRQGPRAGALRVTVDKQPVGIIDCRADQVLVGARIGLGTFDFAPLRKLPKGQSHRPAGAPGPPAGGYHTVLLDPVDDRPVDVDYFILRPDSAGQEAEFLLPDTGTAASLVTWERAGQEPAWSGGSYVRVERAKPGVSSSFTVRVPRAGRYRVRVTPARLPDGVPTKVWLGGQRIGTMDCRGAAPGLGRAIARSVRLPAGLVPLALEASAPGTIALDCVRLDRRRPAWPWLAALALAGAVWWRRRRRRLQVSP